jgi:hypothetical protein
VEGERAGVKGSKRWSGGRCKKRTEAKLASRGEMQRKNTLTALPVGCGFASLGFKLEERQAEEMGRGIGIGDTVATQQLH